MMGFASAQPILHDRQNEQVAGRPGTRSIQPVPNAFDSLIGASIFVLSEAAMPDLLVRDIDPEVFEQMKKIGKAKGESLGKAARDALAEKFKPTKAELRAAADRLRARIAKSPTTPPD